MRNRRADIRSAVARSEFRVPRYSGTRISPVPPMFPHAPAPRRAPRARPPPRAALESGPGRLDRAGALGAPPRNRVRGPGCAGCGGRAAGRRRRLAAAAWQPAPGGAGAHPRRGPEQGRTGGGGARARAARRLRDGTAGGADPRARGRATALWRAVAGSRCRGVPRAGAGKPEPGARRFADHPGILNSSLVHPREVFRAAIAEAAAGIIVVHNHPSGDPTPSADDRAVTRQLVDAGRLLDLPVYGHVIVGGDRYVSFAEAGLL